MTDKKQSNTPNTFITNHSHEEYEHEHKTLIQVATDLVDSVTDMLCREIKKGTLAVEEQEKPLQVTLLNNDTIKKQLPTVDISEHKRMIRRFIKQNHKLKRNRQMRSLEISQKKIKQEHDSKEQKKRTQAQVLEDRRSQIQRRMNEKKMMLKEIRKSAIESNTKISSIRHKKFLYQQKQQQFYSKVILPKLEEQKAIIAKKKQLRKPIDMSEIFNHQRQYETLKINEQVNRSLSIRMISEKKYEPPEFIPESYRRAKQEQEIQKAEKYFKEKENQMNQIRKKEYIKRLNEYQEQQRELSRSLSPVNPKVETKEKVKKKLDRQEAKNVGNAYLKELLTSNRKFSTTKKMTPLLQSQQPPARKLKSQYEISIIKSQRIDKIQKIRNKKIDEIVNDKKLSEYQRHQRLQHQIQRLDEAAEQKINENSNIETINESATIMMSSIHAKLAMLGINSAR